MPSRPLPRMHRVAHLALALLLVAPLLAGAHVHGFGHDASPACSVCTVAKHAPAVVGPIASAIAVVYRPLAAVPVPVVPACAGRCWRPAGRAPPLVVTDQLT